MPATKKTVKKTVKRTTKKTTKAVSAITLAKPSNSAMPKPGSKAPDFTLPDHDGKPVTLSKLGKRVVLYFYPKDDTPGCTIEAKGFSADYAAFQKRGVLVYGVSKDNAKSHCAFRDKYGLKFPLLSDEKGTVIQKYGCWVEKNMYGKKYMGIQRATFLIGADGKIEKVWPKVTPEGHSAEILKGL